MVVKWEENGNLFIQCGKRNNFGLIFERVFECHDKDLHANVPNMLSKEWRSEKYFMSATAKRIMEYLGSVSNNEKQKPKHIT